MGDYPRLLVSSVVRGSRQGDSHGGLYLVDMDAGASEQVLDWNNVDIDWEGRGADRGLRGIAIVGERVFVAASDELFLFDRGFRQLGGWRNAYLKHCHEMSLYDGRLYLTSTGFDAVLGFRLATLEFDFGLKLSLMGGSINAHVFDPRKPQQVSASNVLHINNVHVTGEGVFVSGRHMPFLLQVSRAGARVAAQLPQGTHNAQPHGGGVLFNDTESDRVVWMDASRKVAIPVPRYDPALLTHADFDESGLARQSFGRGLCVLSATLVAAGSSPTTVAIHDLASECCVASLNLSMDVRNAAHGLAVWPF